MPITFNRAMPLFIMRQMDMAQSGINQSMQRLSSGLRINSAADDAAGLAIATGMTSDVRGIVNQFVMLMMVLVCCKLQKVR